MTLSEEQKREAVLIASVGCDRETIAKYVGCVSTSLDEALRMDQAFAASLRRAEASCELTHMRSIQQAARDERHWRASVWWLERRAPERYARRDADAVGRREVVRFLTTIASTIAEAVRNDGDRRRVLDKLGELGESLVDPLLIEKKSPGNTEEQADGVEVEGK